MEPEQARTNLESAVVALAADLPRLCPKDGCARLEWLRREAVLLGFVPVAVLADGLAGAIKRQGQAVTFKPWLDALALAVSCGSDNAEAGPLLLATVGVRFAA